MLTRTRRCNEINQKNFAYSVSHAKKKRRTCRRFSHQRVLLFVEQAEHRHVAALPAVLELGRTAATDGGPAGPSAEARRHRGVLLSVDEISDRAADNTGTGLVGP